MSREVMAAAIRGATASSKKRRPSSRKLLQQYGEDQKVEFPETAFYLPMIYSLMGLEVKTLGELKPVLAHCRELLATEPTGQPVAALSG